MNKNFIKLLIHGQKIDIPDDILFKFKQLFPNAKYIEWYEDNNIYEVIFYNDKQETIARFNKKGELLETLINIPIEKIPEKIKKIIKKYGEILNLIKLVKINKIEYEIIVNNNNLIRYLLIINQNGEIIKSQAI